MTLSSVWKTALRSAALALALPLCAAAQQPACPNPQSPRNLDPRVHGIYDQTTTRSIVTWTSPAQSIQYFARPGCIGQALLRCSEHYHYPVENTQGCSGELAKSLKPEVDPGDRVEIHLAFSPRVGTGCDRRTLNCCEGEPKVVLAYSATVRAGGNPTTPIAPPQGGQLAEWSGSATDPDNPPGECKAPAQWSFHLGCGFPITQAQLNLLGSPKPARDPQPCNRLSRDLTKVQ
jgi:hypothetical protein